MNFIKLTLRHGGNILINLNRIVFISEYTKGELNDDGSYPTVIGNDIGEYVVRERLDDIFSTIQTIQKRNKQ